MFEASREEFEDFVGEGVEAIPEKFRSLIKNVAFLVNEEPSAEQRKQNHVGDDETLFGLYEGVPRPARGEEYGGLVLPDRITIFKKPIEEEATLLTDEKFSKIGRPSDFAKREGVFRKYVQNIVSDTVWHEVAHHFGLDESAVERREEERERGNRGL